jgi:hypothetical protein
VRREIALEYLLRPIVLDGNHALCTRRKHVMHRHAAVDAAYPFLTLEEQKRADEWREREAHDRLWKSNHA